MPRIDPTVTKEAEAIYKSWKQGERGQKVSQAIIEFDNKETIFSPEQEQRIVELIRKELEEGNK